MIGFQREKLIFMMIQNFEQIISQKYFLWGLKSNKPKKLNSNTYARNLEKNWSGKKYPQYNSDKVPHTENIIFFVLLGE